MSTPRKHHYVNKSFLAGWTNDGTVDGQLGVIDMSNGRSWRTRPVNAAKETDLYLIDVAETAGKIEATKIEDTFTLIESAAMPVVTRIIDGSAAPVGAELEDLIALVAIHACRVPARLRWIDDVMRKPVEAAYQQLLEEGKLPMPEDPGLATKMKEWIDQGLITIRIKQNPRLAMMISMLPSVFDLLLKRRWTVLRTEHNAGDLVVSDHPVLLEWLDPTPTAYSPGFGSANTGVSIPLSPTIGLIGLWEQRPRDTSLTRNQVATWNGALLSTADRFIFAKSNFEAMTKSGCIEDRGAILRRLVGK